MPGVQYDTEVDGLHNVYDCFFTRNGYAFMTSISIVCCSRKVIIEKRVHYSCGFLIDTYSDKSAAN